MLYTDGLEAPVEEIIGVTQGQSAEDAAVSWYQHQRALQQEVYEARQRYNRREVNLVYPNPKDREYAFLPIDSEFFHEMKPLGRGSALFPTGSIFQRTDTGYRLVSYHHPDHLTAAILIINPQG